MAEIVAAAPQKLAELRLRRGMLLLAAVASQLMASPTFFSTPSAVEIETGERILGVGIAEIARRVAEEMGRATGSSGTSAGRNAVDVIFAERDEGLGDIFRHRAHGRDVGALVGDLPVIVEGLAVVLAHAIARGIDAGELELGAEHAVLGGVFERGQRVFVSPALKPGDAGAIGGGGRDESAVARRPRCRPRRGDRRSDQAPKRRSGFCLNICITRYFHASAGVGDGASSRRTDLVRIFPQIPALERVRPRLPRRFALVELGLG